MNRFAQPRTQLRALAGVRLAFGLSLLALLAAIVFAGAQGASAAPVHKKQSQTKSLAGLLPAEERPNFVVIQTDDQTIDSLYATYTPPGGVPVQVMPNTLSLIADKGVSLRAATTSPTRSAAPPGSAC